MHKWGGLEQELVVIVQLAIAMSLSDITRYEYLHQPQLDCAHPLVVTTPIDECTM